MRLPGFDLTKRDPAPPLDPEQRRRLALRNMHETQREEAQRSDHVSEEVQETTLAKLFGINPANRDRHGEPIARDLIWDGPVEEDIPSEISGEQLAAML